MPQIFNLVSNLKTLFEPAAVRCGKCWYLSCKKLKIVERLRFSSFCIYVPKNFHAILAGNFIVLSFDAITARRFEPFQTGILALFIIFIVLESIVFTHVENSIETVHHGESTSMDIFSAFTGWETKNRYVIKNSLGQQVFYAMEESDLCMRQCCGPARGFIIHITDNAGQVRTEVVLQMSNSPPPRRWKKTYRCETFGSDKIEQQTYKCSGKKAGS